MSGLTHVVVHTCDPLQDPRWADLVQRHPASSVFHTTGWVEALQRTYGYEPMVVTTSPPDATMTNGVVLCRVASWLTGRRLVSLPFADHCDPLVDDAEDRGSVLTALLAMKSAERLKYVELRPKDSSSWMPAGAGREDAFRLHVLDLRPTLDTLFDRFHKDTIQRKIRRAEREALSHDEGTSPALLSAFYALMLLTRRRHGLPPQPIEWFRNLIACLGERLKIRVAFKERTAIAGILTVRHRKTLVYKYGCSDQRFHNLGAVQLLFWKSIQEAKEIGDEVFDLGRSDSDSTGLITFKERWGAVASDLAYVRLPASSSRWRLPVLPFSKSIVAALPNQLLISAGKLLYRHVG